MAQKEEEHEYLGNFLIVSKGMNTISLDEWIIDMSYHIHICSKKEYFDMFQEENIGFMSLSNGFRCDFTGVGIVKIKMINGIVYTLGVWHVSQRCGGI